MKKLILHSILALGATGVLVFAQSMPNQQPPANGAASTDTEMTSKIRQALIDDTTVGEAAQHIRVNTKNGVVTLRGKVDSSAEKDEAIAKAKQVAGDANVKDDITVKKQ
jgi:osmotically-inducible protein OsmY